MHLDRHSASGRIFQRGWKNLLGRAAAIVVVGGSVCETLYVLLVNGCSEGMLIAGNV